MTTSNSEGQQPNVSRDTWVRSLTFLTVAGIMGLAGWDMLMGVPYTISRMITELRVHWGDFDLIQGRVVDVHVDNSHGDHVPLTTVEYMVGDQAMRHDFAVNGFGWETDRKALLMASKNYPTDSEQWVFVNNRNPQEGYLRKAIAKSGGLLILALVFESPFLAAILVFASLVWQWRKARGQAALSPADTDQTGTTPVSAEEPAAGPSSGAIASFHPWIVIAVTFLLWFPFSLLILFVVIGLVSISHENDVPTHWTNRAEVSIAILGSAVLFASWRTTKMVNRAQAG